MVFTVVGDVANPGVYELPLGTPLRTLLVDIAGAEDIKAVYSGGLERGHHPGRCLDTRCASTRCARPARHGLGRVRRLRLSRNIVDVLATC
jgi:NADH:ubiquinone oxidoreductase subunit F (NADH-binding)